MSTFIKVDILKPSIIQHFKIKISIIIKMEEKSGDYTIIRNVKLSFLIY